MSPVQSPILDISRTWWLLSDLKASWRRWTNAVDRITPVPKCFPMKNKMRGIETRVVWVEMYGNDTAIRPRGQPCQARKEGQKAGQDVPKRDTTKIIAVVPARWSISDSLEATANAESMATGVQDRRGLAVLGAGGMNSPGPPTPRPSDWSDRPCTFPVTRTPMWGDATTRRAFGLS